MTAVIHHGPPGSYKTFALVQRVLIPALQKGRLVITNIRGFNDIDRIKKILGVAIPDTAKILYLEPDTEGYELMARFFHWAPAGSLIAMDEGQRVYPLRNKRFDHLDQPDNIPIFDFHDQPLINQENNQFVCRPSTLENAIDQHRHFNWDIYISTTNIAKINGEIRKAVEWGYRHRDNTGLLPWYKNTWSEFRHDSESSGKSVSHYSGVPKRYKADFRVFDCYQSTATGTAKLSNENISLFRDPKLRFMAGVIVVAISFVIYNGIAAYDRISARTQKENPATVSPDSIVDNETHDVPIVDDPIVDDAKRVPSSVVHVNPFKDMELFFTGSINDVLFFEVKLSDESYLPLSLLELEAFGYRLKHRFGSVVSFELAGNLVYALPKPRTPILEREARTERSATQLSAGIF